LLLRQCLCKVNDSRCTIAAQVLLFVGMEETHGRFRAALDEKRYGRSASADGGRLAHHENRAYRDAVALRNPAALPLRVELHHEFGGNLGDKGLEGLIPVVLLRIERAMARNCADRLANMAEFEAELAAIRINSIVSLEFCSPTMPAASRRRG